MTINNLTKIKMLFWTHKYVTVSILLIGTFLNLSFLVFGMEPAVKYVFIPKGEIILATFMLTSLVLGLVVYRYLDLHHRVTRIIQRVILGYFVLLVLMHTINNLLLGHTAAYLATFSSPIYPYGATLVLALIAAFTAHLKLSSNTTTRF